MRIARSYYHFNQGVWSNTDTKDFVSSSSRKTFETVSQYFSSSAKVTRTEINLASKNIKQIFDNYEHKVKQVLRSRRFLLFIPILICWIITCYNFNRASSILTKRMTLDPEARAQNFLTKVAQEIRLGEASSSSRRFIEWLSSFHSWPPRSLINLSAGDFVKIVKTAALDLASPDRKRGRRSSHEELFESLRLIVSADEDGKALYELIIAPLS
ncbi:MAG: hypothetical protein A3F09_04130 [Chlamydiae bacterium RIFCSPHIGHO2_12_FULL_49_11]|nr:MAG: hypothetical protein A3F09_04130 [Chlamydiae bacterium RIFCSPHIGHO2_12_FULL_49_11]